PDPYDVSGRAHARDLNPRSWQFANPMPPPAVTQAMANRWSRIGDNSLTVGIPLTQDLAPYWEVTLRPENMDRLAQMDVCYVSAAGGALITYQDRELLRRLVDAGVLLWIDNRSTLTFSNVDGMFFPLDFPLPSAG